MSQTVDITLSVIDRMNLTDHDKKNLISQLHSSIEKTGKDEIKVMSYEDRYTSQFEKWIVENEILYAPKIK